MQSVCCSSKIATSSKGAVLWQSSRETSAVHCITGRMQSA